MTENIMVHKSVLLEELIENLNLKPGMTVIDGTLGAGGHSEAVLEKILPGGKLISIDWDKKSIDNFENRLEKRFCIAKRELIHSAGLAPVNINKKNDDRAFSHFKKLGNRKGNIVGYWCGAADNYANIKEIIRGLGEKTVDAVFVDLGFSSDQIEDEKRGFSFRHDGPLDMRYSPEKQNITASDIVNKYSPEKLAEIFREFGEEKFAKRIAREIEIKRKKENINSTKELVEIIAQAVPEKYRKGKIHFATKVFQALRIEVNRELENLKTFLNISVDALASEGRLAIISFHSLEDRLVKNFFQRESRECVCPPRFPTCVCGHEKKLKVITKKPIVASVTEIEKNPRSRSAKLRVAEKI